MNIHQVVQYLDALPEKIDSPTYTFLGNPEEEDTVLSKRMDLCFENNLWNSLVPTNDLHHTQHVKVMVCMYRRVRIVIPVCSNVREVVPIEYLSYFMEKTDNRYSFPTFQYKCETVMDDMNDDESDENAFKSACIDHILTVRSLEQKGLAKHAFSRAEFDIGYKGFITEKNKVIVFFDSDTFETVFTPQESSSTKEYSANHAWATVDEIINKQSIWNVDIDRNIIRIFKKNPLVWNIKYDGRDIDYPRQMYALIPSDVDQLESVDHENGVDDLDLVTETYPITGKTLLHMSMALPYSYSDLFSDRYLFTKQPLPETQTQTRVYKRYACFIYNPRTVLDPTYKPHRDCIKKYPNNTIDVMKMDAEDDEVAEQMRETPCVVFVDKLAHHNRLTIWGFLQYEYFDEIDQ
jgi:hypothetical protein